MKLGIPLVLTVLLATPSLASAQRTEGGTRTRAAAGARAAAEPAKKDAARKGAKAKEAGGPSPHARNIARQTKSVYVYAQESCAQSPDRCDQTLLQDAEARFLESCGACNTTERCEAERDAVKAGTARASQDPCRR